MRLETAFDDINPERLMFMMNSGELTPEQVKFVHDLFYRRKLDFNYLNRLEQEVGFKAVVYRHKKYLVFHEKSANPRDLLFIAMFRHQYEGHLWGRCPACGAWFVDREAKGVCSIGCGHKMRNLASSGVTALPRK